SVLAFYCFFFSSRRRHTRSKRDWSSDVCSSDLFCKPMALLLLQKGATVTICNSRTPDLGAMTGQADVLVVAAGRPKLVSAGMVRSEERRVGKEWRVGVGGGEGRRTAVIVG